MTSKEGNVEKGTLNIALKIIYTRLEEENKCKMTKFYLNIE